MHTTVQRETTELALLCLAMGKQKKARLVKHRQKVAKGAHQHHDDIQAARRAEEEPTS